MTNSLLNYKRKNKTLWAINISHAHTVCLYKHLLNIKVVKAGSTPGLGKAQSFVCTDPACSSEIIRFLSLLNAHLLDFFPFCFPPHWESRLSIYFSLRLHRERERKMKWECTVRGFNAGTIGDFSSSFLEGSMRVGRTRKRGWEFYYPFRKSQREGQLPFMAPWGSMRPAAFHPQPPRIDPSPTASRWQQCNTAAGKDLLLLETNRVLDAYDTHLCLMTTL